MRNWPNGSSDWRGLQETEADANKMQAAVAERVKEGVDSEMEGTKARLSAARVRLRIAEAKARPTCSANISPNSRDFPPRDIQTDPDSIPASPAAPAGPTTPAQDCCRFQSLGARPPWNTPARNICVPRESTNRCGPASISPRSTPCSRNSTTIRTTTFLRSPAPHRSAKFLCVTSSFQQNNATVGVSIRFPLFNASQRSRAQAADADALKASKQAEAARNQVSEETLRLQRSVTQMQAARDVAQLEYEIAAEEV